MTCVKLRPITAALLIIGGYLFLPSSAFAVRDLGRGVMQQYARIVYANYDAALQSALALDAAIHKFLESPSDETLTAARDAWVRAHKTYGPSEAFRFYDGPIDAPITGPEGQLNGWPLDEAYIDYVKGAPEAGIINDDVLHPSITRQVLIDLNEKNGEENIATGYHAIEFLLWGQDFSSEGPGERSWRDYVTSESNPKSARRAEYLRIVSGLLVDDLKMMHREWDPALGHNYVATFLALEPNEALQKIFTGIGMLAGDELSSERIAVAYETSDQEDEQSCFSDTTHLDLMANAEGIRNVYLGQYGELHGVGLSHLVMEKNPQLDKEVRSRIEAVLVAIGEIPAPLDQAIRSPSESEAKVKMLAAIEALESLTRSLATAAGELNIQLNVGAAE